MDSAANGVQRPMLPSGRWEAQRNSPDDPCLMRPEMRYSDTRWSGWGEQLQKKRQKTRDSPAEEASAFRTLGSARFPTDTPNIYVRKYARSNMDKTIPA